MIQSSKKLLLLASLAISSAIVHADIGTLTGSPYFFTRSQSRNKVLQDVAEVGRTDLYGMDCCWYGMFDVVLAYERSSRRDHIVDALFGPVGTNTICQPTLWGNCDPCDHGRTFNIQGSAVPNRDPNAWLADYFYLPTDFSSTISFRPRISNTLIFLDYYQCADDCLYNIYLRVYGPITFSHWDLRFCENVINRGTTGYNEGYFTPTVVNGVSVPANTLLDNFSSYAIGEVPSGLMGVTIPNSSTSVGVTAQPLKYAKLSKESRKKTGFADLRFEIGRDCWQTPCSHLGFNLQGAAPTGNRPEAFFCFQPVIGNGKHWELGGGVTGHYDFYVNECETKILGFWVDANITHLFSARQQRTFDLKNKPVSRYMLAERLGTPVVNLFANTTGGGAIGGVAPTLQFQGEFAPVANLTTTNVNVSIDVQADVVAWFNFINCNWSFDVGYNFWGTSCEKIRVESCETDCKNPLALCNASQLNTWALKGDAQVYGFNGTTIPVALSATESGASITSGTNVLVGAPVNSALSTNAGVDNAEFAQATTSGSPLGTTTAVFPVQIRTSFTPITLSCCDLALTRNKGLTHKVFAHASYGWDCNCVMPFFGIGGSAEFAQSKRGCCPPICNSSGSINCTANCADGHCLRNAASFWSIWIKGGISF